jgi:hypothetical protein
MIQMKLHKLSSTKPAPAALRLVSNLLGQLMLLPALLAELLPKPLSMQPFHCSINCSASGMV